MENIYHKNSLLRALDPATVKRLSLTPVVFELRHEIEFPGTPIGCVYFVEEGMASMTTTFQDGSQVEVGMFGYESIIGVSSLMGDPLSLNRVYTQVAGHGFTSPIEVARKEFERLGDFHRLSLRYVQTQLLQASQSAGCNAKHEVDQRLARWLLLCADRVQSDTYKMSHEFLADMLGSSRSTVSVAARLLKDAGLIGYSRGLIQILNRAQLEQRSCECYQVIKDHLEVYLKFETDALIRAAALNGFRQPRFGKGEFQR